MALHPHALCKLFRICGGDGLATKAESRERKRGLASESVGHWLVTAVSATGEVRRPPGQCGLVGGGRGIWSQKRQVN